MTFIDHLIKYAENELKLIGFDQTPVGETMLEFLKNSAELSKNDVATMTELSGMLTRLINRQPISPVTESDFVSETYTENSNTVEIMRCTRYPYLYRMPDGKYYDDRAVAFRYADSNSNDKMYLYQSEKGSKQEVTLPYYPSEELRVLAQDAKN